MYRQNYSGFNFYGWVCVCVLCGKSSLILSRNLVNNNANNHAADTVPGTVWLKCIILENYVSDKNMLGTIGLPSLFPTKTEIQPSSCYT